MTYQLHRRTDNCYKKVMATFSGMFPAAMVPDKRTFHRIWDKQNEYYTVHNLKSSSSPGFGWGATGGIIPENIEEILFFRENKQKS